MTAKLHLRARAPNEGARQLAQWVMRQFGGDMMSAVRATPAFSIVLLQRLIEGDVLPGTAIAEPLGRHVGICHRAWRRPPAGGWFDVADVDA